MLKNIFVIVTMHTSDKQLEILNQILKYPYIKQTGSKQEENRK